MIGQYKFYYWSIKMYTAFSLDNFFMASFFYVPFCAVSDINHWNLSRKALSFRKQGHFKFAILDAPLNQNRAVWTSGGCRLLPSGGHIEASSTPSFLLGGGEGKHFPTAGLCLTGSIYFCKLYVGILLDAYNRHF